MSYQTDDGIGVGGGAFHHKLNNIVMCFVCLFILFVYLFVNSTRT